MKIKNALSAPERYDKILHLVETTNQVSVEQICDELSISLSTARRDLDNLHSQGSLQRVHGGAISIRKTTPQNSIFQRINLEADSKMKIGSATAALVNPGETVFLGAGTTILQVAKKLLHLDNLTVVTNSFLVINELIQNPNITILDIGGIVRHSEYSLISISDESWMPGIFVDKVIMGISGIDINQGLTHHYLRETMLGRKILKMGSELIIAADHTKCGKVSTLQLAPINVVDTLVTDNETSPDFITAMKNLDIKVVQP